MKINEIMGYNIINNTFRQFSNSMSGPFIVYVVRKTSTILSNSFLIFKCNSFFLSLKFVLRKFLIFKTNKFVSRKKKQISGREI